LITEMIKANPSFKPPADYKPEKKYRRLRIPLEEYPGYNFIGLIIGPRGNTQKGMERVSCGEGGGRVGRGWVVVVVVRWWWGGGGQQELDRGIYGGLGRCEL
jgi:hypothetical protein